MGPYCNYCGGRCFDLASVVLGCVDGARQGLWDLVLQVTGQRPPELMASCEGGKAHDKKVLGLCRDDLLLLRDAYERGMHDDGHEE